MRHIKDKGFWFGYHQHVNVQPFGMPVGLGIAFIGAMLLVLAVMVTFSMSPEAGTSLAFVAVGGTDWKALNDEKADLTKKALALNDKANGRTFTAEEQTEYDGIKASLATNKQLLGREADRMDMERTNAGADFDRRGRISIHERVEDDPSGGFKTHTDFLTSVMNWTTGANHDPRLKRFIEPPSKSSQRYQATQGSDEQGVYSDPHGGFLMPTTVMPGVLAVTPEQDPLEGLITPVPMETEIITFNARVDKDHATSVSGGLTVTRRPETVDGTSSRMQFEPITMHAHELFGLAYASERILAASPTSFIALLSAGFGDEFAANAMQERINGSGTGEFLGVLKADCLITVSKETGQKAATIVTENIDGMAERCWRYGSSVWLANHNTRKQLKGLVRNVGTGGVAVPYFMSNPAGGQETLDGRPIFFTEFAKSLGTKGDLILGNWSQYTEGTYKPLEQAESIHVRFIANERAFRFWKMNDGQPWWKSALTPKNGATLSPFVVTETRS